MTTVIMMDSQIDPDLLELAKVAVRCREARKNENIKEWAEKLANDVAEPMGKKINHCEKCDGEGWLWWNELAHYSGPGRQTGQDDTRYPCDECYGIKDPGMVRDRELTAFDPTI